jgi:glycosyltransferase involved in cell wall biosynthesis
MIVLIRCNDIISDPRVGKYLHYFKNNNHAYKVIGWKRVGETRDSENTIYFNRNSGYNVGGFKAAIDRFFWILFVIKQLFRMRKEITIIHGCDLDGVFPAIVFKLITRKKVTIIFDVFDWFSDTLYNQSFIIRFVFRAMERLCVNYSDEIIVCEEERIAQIPYRQKKKIRVLQNIPSFKSIDFLYKEEKYLFNNGKKTISYVGGFYRERFLDELIEVAKAGYINLNIAGYGDKDLENKCLSLSEHPNVNYFGKVLYKEGLNIMYNSDLIYAMYCTSNKNHVFAAPNKYYEAMLLGKPIISNAGTILSTKILKNKTGFIITESIDDLKNLILTLNANKVQELSHNARSLWEKTYENKIDDYLSKEYAKIIN